MRINLECTNWGVPKDAAAMVATDSGAWIIQEAERGRVYLRTTLKSGELKQEWFGKIEVPLIVVDWK